MKKEDFKSTPQVASKNKKKTGTIPLTDVERDFYAYLGLLSVKFSEMENYLSQIVVKLIHNDDAVITAILTDDNQLHKNLELLKRINKVREFRAPYMAKMIDQIGKVRPIRNLFIHGVWSTPYEFQNDIVSYCNDIGLKSYETKDKKGNVVGKGWQFNEHKEFRLSYIIQEIQRITEIIYVEKAMLKELESEEFF